MLQPHAHREAVTVDRREGPYGEIVLRRRDTHFEIIANGTFLMDTSDGRSERLLVDAALQALDPAIAAPHLLIGGLGVGFSLARAAARPRWHRISVVERDPAVVDWHRQGHLAPYSEGALDDPRVALVAEDLVAHLLRTADTPGSGLGCRSRTTRCAWTSTTGRTGQSPRTTAVSTVPAAWPPAGAG